ncbi:MAG TPA: hypothetical protein VFN23_11325, partial [Ktedonobacteraceae bacterium]|nr:hypothetical protein [Ktedonobacteraceae bacterium]
IASWPKLVNSSVSISKAGTLLIGDLEGSHQVYHEYSWQQKAFVETVFPALYPVLSRAEAEQLQGQVSKQDTLPWHDPRGTAERLALQVFGWSRADFEANIQAENTDSIEVTLLHRNPTITVIVTLQQLISSNPDGLWFVTSAQTPGIVLNQPAAASSVHAPISLQGSGIQANSKLSLRLLDSSFQVIRGTTPGSVSTDRSKRFRGSLSYGSEAASQAGVIVIQGAGKKKPYQAGEIMLSKVLLG